MSDQQDLHRLLMQIMLPNFVSEETRQQFNKHFMPQKYLDNPSLGIANDPERSAIYLIIKKYIDLNQEKLKSHALQTRHGLREPVFLKIGGHRFQLDLELLMMLADYFGDEPGYAPLVQALFELKEPMISAKLVWTGLFTQEQGEALWHQGNAEVCKALLRNGDFIMRLSDAQAADIIALQDMDMLESIANTIYVFFYDSRRKFQDCRLSEKMRDELLHCLLMQDSDFILRRLWKQRQTFSCPIRRRREKSPCEDEDE